ncbi:hypothetical protein AOQ84DRAFT_20815 [Glonium stellatum]|uniref:Uncharacterized protein n=1 Tax=Glonium stellatum TaxID=574774 RepID=A0A8E2FCE0_9PEZI|nr:hypothetical protein AOQ84DRAFT_20815 [Glonium stellatum]
MQIGDKRNTTRKAQIFWSLIALILAIFCLVWFRHSSGRDAVTVSSARPYLNLTRVGWALVAICAVVTITFVLLLSFESSDKLFLALSGTWALSTLILIIGNVMTDKKDGFCPIGEKCASRYDTIKICSFIVTTVGAIQCAIVFIAFLQIRSLKKEAERSSRRLVEKEHSAGSMGPAPNSTTGLGKLFKSKALSRFWTAGIKPSSSFRDRP